MAPIVLSDQNFQITQENLSNLQHLSDLLHLFHHRNKNQHRHSHWYKHFNTFRRQLQSLLSDLDSLNSIPRTNTSRVEKRKNVDPKLISRTQQRLEFWRDVMFTKWQFAFSQIIADGRFSVLGVFLYSCLAEVGKVTGVVGMLDDLGDVEVEKVFKDFAETEKDWDEGTPLRREDEGVVVRREDNGEVVRREDAAQDLEAKGVEEVPNKVKISRKRVAETTNAKPKKKRKKGGNAIDDIFG
ncbi:Ribonuclease MRP protein subunit RMP1 [Pseudocercospora fuligena]|uniref:Ribonuclease MRP protein subunit RMP1 n=1 Tax=Pseudocercospora fuligena TaxID=685502 RepID=A0A8H6VIJ5_9PEZI|nr:Ribonuclease MRP protein subunit RMP1 [Pseudocercospora fuligena]